MSKRILMLALVTLSSMALSESVRAEDKPETVSVLGDSKLTVPAEFKRVEKQSGILEHEFQASTGEGKEAETARVTMMGALGSVAANIERWKDQFTGGDEKAIKTEEIKVGKWQVYIVDVNGNFAERMGGGPFAGGKLVNHENYAMVGAILVHPEGQQYFVKMIGPAGVVKANRKPFVDMIKSIGQ